MLWRMGADPLTRRIGSLFSHLDGSLASAPALWRAMTGHARRQQPKSRGKGNGSPKPPKPPKPLNLRTSETSETSKTSKTPKRVSQYDNHPTERERTRW